MQNLFTKEEYQNYVNKKSPNSPILRNLFWAFCIGGLICVIGQGLRNYFLAKGYNIDTSSNITSIILIFAGAFLTGINVYDDIGKKAGAGSIVPITGFANSIVSPAMEFKSEGYILGVGSRMFVIAGPVLVYGIATSVLVGIIYFFLR